MTIRVVFFFFFKLLSANVFSINLAIDETVRLKILDCNVVIHAVVLYYFITTNIYYPRLSGRNRQPRTDVTLPRLYIVEDAIFFFLIVMRRYRYLRCLQSVLL